MVARCGVRAEGETASGLRREAGLVLLMRGEQRGRDAARCSTRSYFRFSSAERNMPKIVNEDGDVNVNVIIDFNCAVCLLE